MKGTHITICGASIAGITTAYYLAVKYRQQQIVLIDKNLPMSLTTSKSGENFRDYWSQGCRRQSNTGVISEDVATRVAHGRA